MDWNVEFHYRAEKELKKLDKNTQQEVFDYLTKRVLRSKDPRDLGKPLRKDKFGLWRYRVADYRVIAQIQEKRLVILVLQVAKRDKVYR